MSLVDRNSRIVGIINAMCFQVNIIIDHITDFDRYCSLKWVLNYRDYSLLNVIVCGKTIHSDPHCSGNKRIDGTLDRRS